MKPKSEGLWRSLFIAFKLLKNTFKEVRGVAKDDVIEIKEGTVVWNFRELHV